MVHPELALDLSFSFCWRHVGEGAGCWLEQAKTTLFFLIHGTLAHDHQVVAVAESARPGTPDLCAATPDVQQTRQTVSPSQEMSPPMPNIFATALAAEHLPTWQPRMYTSQSRAKHLEAKVNIPKQKKNTSWRRARTPAMEAKRKSQAINKT